MPRMTNYNIPTMFDPNEPVPQEVLEAMLKLSTADDEAKDLQLQQRMSEMLMGNALETGKAPSGGKAAAAGVLAKGLQGYMGGKMYADGRESRKGLREGQRSGRRSFFDLLQGNGEGGYDPAYSYSGPVPDATGFE